MTFDEIARSLGQGNDRFGLLAGGTLPAPRITAIRQAFKAWRAIKDPYTRGSEPQASDVEQIAEYLGFRLIGEPGSSASVQGSGAGWCHFHVRMSAGKADVPQVGSARNGKWEVLVVTDRPGPQDLINIWGQAGIQSAVPLLIFYMNRLPPLPWTEIVTFANDRDVSALILDEILLVYLAREYDNRLNSFFRCTLPGTPLNPFGTRGQVLAPEMFVGRDKLKVDLARPDGPAILYGGRQLGKSSLLKQVQLSAHDPARSSYSILLDINNIETGLGSHSIVGIWRFMEPLLAMLGVAMTDAEQIATEPDVTLTRAMLARPDAKVLILFDEADGFLVADADNGFKTLSSLKTVMENTNQRFKVVFAGLHNVGRFSSIPNQPLVHLGAPQVIRPLAPREAEELVRKVELFGFELPKECLLRILFEKPQCGPRARVARRHHQRTSTHSRRAPLKGASRV